MTLLDTYITMADTTSMDLDQDLSVFGFFDRNFFDGPRRAWLLNDAGFAALWNVWSHCLDYSKQLESKGGFYQNFCRSEKNCYPDSRTSGAMFIYTLASCWGGY
jgi:hypothetical protein